MEVVVITGAITRRASPGDGGVVDLLETRGFPTSVIILCMMMEGDRHESAVVLAKLGGTVKIERSYFYWATL